jgi:predicted RNA binding protein YcfA (HicA-like mRNA interferase family)
MGGKLPVISGRDAVRTFESFGWTLARQSGSHMILTKPGSIATLSVPNHSTVAKGTLRGLIRAAEVTVDDFIAAVK